MNIINKFYYLSFFFLINLLFCTISVSDNHNINETLELIKKDLKTLEKAVYSGTVEIKNTNSNLSDDVYLDCLLYTSDAADE